MVKTITKYIIDVNEALALLLGMDLHQFCQKNIDLIYELEEEAIKCHIEKITAKEFDDVQAINESTLAAQTASHKFQYASALRVRLAAEIARVRMKLPAIIRIVDDSRDDIHCYDVTFEELSLLAWQKHHKIPTGSPAFLSSHDSTVPLPGLSDDYADQGGDNIRTTPSNNTEVKYTDSDKDKHSVLIALLLEEVSSKGGAKYTEKGHPNYKQIATLVNARHKTEKLSINGFSKDRLQKKFSDALKIKDTFKAPQE